MLDKPNSTILPNDFEVFCLDADEVYVLYKQVEEYLKYGITVSKGNIVFDVGANIGLFTIWLDDRFEGNLEIYAFEPIPDIYRILELNIKKLKNEKILAHPYGLSDISKDVECGYFPNASALSSVYPDNSRKEKLLFKDALINSLKIMGPDSSFVLKVLKNMPKFMASFFLEGLLKRVFTIENRSCKMKTVSDVINEYDIEKIDLLKVDVEKSELDVISGIDDCDWQKINQTVIEIHDIDNRLLTLKNTLHQKGFSNLHVIQEEAFKDTNIYCIYASKVVRQAA